MFEGKTGFNQHLLSDDPDVREGVRNWLDRVLGYYGERGGVDVEVIENQVLLVEKSVAYLYGDFTPLEIPYEKGSRPHLEAVLAEVVHVDMDEMQTMLALMRRCRDNRDAARREVDFTGGTEEELLKRGAIMCNEIHRVFVCLCQIAGLPARLVCSHVSGHMMSEVYVEGTWMCVDAMKGMYCFRDDGKPASTWDLVLDPGLFDRQCAEVWEDCRPTGGIGLKEFEEFDKAYAQAKARECYFHPKEAVALGNYFVWEHHRYTYPWRHGPADPVRLERARHAENLFRWKHGWPPFYFNHYLFEGGLRTGKNGRERFR